MKIDVTYDVTSNFRISRRMTCTSLDVTNADFEFNDNHENRFIKCLKCDKELPVTLDSHGSFKITSVVRHLEKDHTPTTTASITTATASSNQRDSVAETSGQEQNQSGAEKQSKDF